MKRPVRKVARGQSRNVVRTTSAPIGGWNARDPISDMEQDQALSLVNMFPEVNRVRVRKGHTSHATGLTSAVESLMSYHSPAGSASDKMFAAANSAVYDVTSTGAVGAAEFSSLTNTRFQHVQFGNSAGHFLYIVNGADAPRYYDGSSWTTPTITGVTATSLIHVNIFKKRLFFIESGSLSFWYFPVETISGAISEFSLESYASKGGFLMAMGTWTRDAGDGQDDIAVFLTSEGEAIVFQGDDPATAADWALIGVFQVGAPVGRRCMVKVGSDLILITEDGFTPLSRALPAGRISRNVSISDRIVENVNQALRSYGSNFGWQAVFYPRARWAIFNVPIREGAEMEQYVANTTTGAWCRFTNMNANCWEVFNERLYFGGNATVFEADTGLDDNGSDILFEVQTSFQYFGSPGQKHFSMVRPIVGTEGDVQFALEVNVDYENRQPTDTPTYSGSTGADWDVGLWDVALWGGGLRIQREWQSIAGVGFCASLYLKGAAKDIQLEWYSTDWSFEQGGTL